MKTLDGNCRLGIGAAVLMLLAGAAASVHAGDYYASPAGDDNAPGAEGQRPRGRAKGGPPTADYFVGATCLSRRAQKASALAVGPGVALPWRIIS